MNVQHTEQQQASTVVTLQVILLNANFTETQSEHVTKLNQVLWTD